MTRLSQRDKTVASIALMLLALWLFVVELPDDIRVVENVIPGDFEQRGDRKAKAAA